jgi:hypothetical protein
MLTGVIKFPTLGGVPLERVVAGAWIVVVAVICIRCYLRPQVHSLLPIYLTAAHNWQTGNDMYAAQPGLPDRYRYSPTAAVLLHPLTQMPDGVGEVVWRLFNVAVFLGAMVWWGRAVLPAGSPLTSQQWSLLFLLALPLALGSVNNGQINTLMAGLMLATVAAVAGERWNLAAALAALAVLLKVYPLALALLLILVHPHKFGLRFLTAMLLGLALPFLCQHSDYVLEQYQTWWQLLAGDDRSHWPRRLAPQDLWLVFRIAHLDMSPKWYVLLRLALAGAVALLGLVARLRGCAHRKVLAVLSTQVGCWIILCGPNSEACTYILLAPVLGWAMIDAWQAQPGAGRRWCLSGVLGLVVLRLVMRLFSGAHDPAAGLLPVSALLLWICLLMSHLSVIGGKGRWTALDAATSNAISPGPGTGNHRARNAWRDRCATRGRCCAPSL